MITIKKNISKIEYEFRFPLYYENGKLCIDLKLSEIKYNKILSTLTNNNTIKKYDI